MGTSLPAMRWLLAALVIASMGCQPEGEIVYHSVSSPDGDLVDLTLEVHSPDPLRFGPGPHPAVLYIHGGGWAEGSLASHGYGERGYLANEQGYVTVSINYRLTTPSHDDGTPFFPWPAQAEDVRCAVRWMRANAAQYAIDPEAIGAFGYSAGGHLALMLGAKHAQFDSEQCGWDASADVQAIVGKSAPADLAWVYDNTEELSRFAIQRLLALDEGAAVHEHEGTFADASPIEYVNGTAPATLLLQGAEDQRILPENARRMAAALDEAGVPVDLIEFEGVGHQWQSSELSVSDGQSMAFFDRVLAGEDSEQICSPWPSCESAAESP